MKRVVISKIGVTLVVVSMLTVLIGVGTFHGNYAYAWGIGSGVSGNQGGNQGGNQEDTQHGGSGDQVEENNHHGCDIEHQQQGEEQLNEEDFCFLVVPESSIGSLALVGSSLAALGGFMFVKMRSGSILNGDQ